MTITITGKYVINYIQLQLQF